MLPETISFYNSTQFGVDITNQMARKYSVNRQDQGGGQFMYSTIFFIFRGLIHEFYTKKLLTKSHLSKSGIHFSYVRGHSGNLGNDSADQLAKEATCQVVNLLMSVPLSHWKHLAWERTVSSPGTPSSRPHLKLC
ncbi:hypothetical protein TNCV_3691851 [Trichonephila clavipes]|nr:hypothetical protein TNCV_3691851 [Trichonephila clavipes]